MAFIKTASPAVVVNEIDLTRPGLDPITTNVGAFAGPFQKGPVGEPVLIKTEAELVSTFGYPTEENYEYWWSVSNFLEYGGVCYVVRPDDNVGGSQTLKNSVSNGSAVYVKNNDDYLSQYNSLTSQFIAKTPGKWGNNLGVALIDAGADQRVTLSQAPGTTPTPGSTVNFNGGARTATVYKYSTATIDGSTKYYLDVINLTGGRVTTSDVFGSSVMNNTTLKVNSTTGFTTNDFVRVDNEYFKIDSVGSGQLTVTGAQLGSVGAGTVQHTSGSSVTKWTLEESSTSSIVNEPDGTPEITETENSITLFSVDGFSVNDYAKIKRISTGSAGTTSFEYVKIINVDSDSNTIQVQRGQLGTPAISFDNDIAQNEITTELSVIKMNFVATVTTTTLTESYPSYTGSITITAVTDWYDEQEAFGGIPWRRFAPRPTTSTYASARNGSNDLLNIIVYDKTGQITGSINNVLEIYSGLSKLKGATSSEGDNIYYVDAITSRSSYVYATNNISVITEGTLNSSLSNIGSTDATQKLKYITKQDIAFNSGVDNLSATLGELQAGYDYFEQSENFEIDFLIQGPGLQTESESVAKSNYLISIAETRRDCIAFVSPPRSTVLNLTNSKTQTENVINWANQIASSSYVVLDSGYKYTYDRFRDVYVYVPLNPDIAGLMVNTARVAEQWYSPAGLTRGQIRNAVRLPYNPTKAQRDDLYVKRVNPIVSFPGEGVVLFGDKTGLASQSAFNRINVRKLFLVLERTIAKAARAQLFEFNDEVTRALFRNIVDPFLREVQSKRGITDYLIVCDASNNTGEVIDRNEFVADIYIKPARSINFVTLNFIATRTGTSFAEATGLFRGQ